MPLRTVLVRPHSPGNVGSCARASKAFGATLVLVSPRVDLAHPDLLAFASGAEDLVANAQRFETLEELAATPVHMVALSSLRGRAAGGLPPRATLPALKKHAASGNVALVFGPERSGLTTPELRLCDELIALPTRPEMTTLSLPQALTATLALLAATRPAAEIREGATRAELARLHEVLSSGGFPRPGQDGPAAELQAFWKRARPTSREIALLLGALESLRRK